MTHRVANTPLFTGSHVVSKWGGLGIPGSQIPAAGDNGASPLANDQVSPSAEYRLVVTSLPTLGTLVFFPDTSYEFSGAPAGNYVATLSTYEDSALYGTSSLYLQIGSPASAFTVTTEDAAFYGATKANPVSAFAIQLADSDFVGGAIAHPSARFTVVTEDLVFAGGTFIAGLPPVSAFALMTEGATFSGNAEVILPPPAECLVSATTEGAAFAGESTGVWLPGACKISAVASEAVFAGEAHAAANAVIAVITEDSTFIGGTVSGTFSTLLTFNSMISKEINVKSNISRQLVMLSTLHGERV